MDSWPQLLRKQASPSHLKWRPLSAWICHPPTRLHRERHRHRYEFNREYEALLTGAGLRITGTTPDATYVEIVEIPSHPFFLGCQFHPEFKSKPLEPHPLFRAFIEASYGNRDVHTVTAIGAVTLMQER